MKEITKSQLLDFLAFHGIQNIYIQINKKPANSITTELKTPQTSDIKINQSKPYNIPKFQNLNTHTVINKSQSITTASTPVLWNIGMAAQRRWNHYENTLTTESQRQIRQNFIDSYERMQELDRIYPITPWSAVDLATRGIGYRNTERYNQYKQEIAQEEARKREQELLIQQSLMYKLQRERRNKSQ